jgi:hypothetical protein
MPNSFVNEYPVSRMTPRVFDRNMHAYQHNSVGVFNPDGNDEYDYSSDSSDPYGQTTNTPPVINTQNHPRVPGPNGFHSFADGSVSYRSTPVALSQLIRFDYNGQVLVNHVRTVHRSQKHFQVHRRRNVSNLG